MPFINLIIAGVKQRCQCAFSPVRDSTADSPRMYSDNLKYREYPFGSWLPWGADSHCYLKTYDTPYLQSFGNTNWPAKTFKAQLGQSLGTGGRQSRE